MVASWGAGCGYALVGRATSVPDDVRSVYLKTFENKTNRVQLEEILTRAVADELVTRKRFQLTTAAEGAQAEIRGSVIGFDVTPVSLDAQGRATEYQIIITAQVRFVRTNEERTILGPATAMSSDAAIPSMSRERSTLIARIWRSKTSLRTSPRRWSATCWRAFRAVGRNPPRSRGGFGG